MLGPVHQLIIIIVVVASSASHVVDAIIFDGVASLHVWISISSLVSKDTNNHKSLIFRQIELNWINAPLDHDTDYIGLYLDSEPSERSMPVSVHRLAGQVNGHIITDFFLPQLDFLNETLKDLDHHYRRRSPAANSDDSSSSSSSGNEMASGWNDFLSSNRRDQELPKSPMSSSQCLGYCLAYHSLNKILASNCLRTNPTWMQDLFQYIGSRSLPSLMLPGSHNSATYPKSLDKSALSMLNKYQMNQDEPIFNQLVYGIRYLDLRVGYSKVKQRAERLWIYHDIFRTDVSVAEVLEQVKQFLEMTSHEIIIMDFHRFTVGFQNENQATQRERHSKLVELILSKLGSYIVPSYLGQHAPLNELVPTGKRLVVGYAARSLIVGSNELSILGQLSAGNSTTRQQVQDIDAHRQDQEDSITGSNSSINKTTPAVAKQQSADRRVASGLFSKLKSLKSTLFKRSLSSTHSTVLALFRRSIDNKDTERDWMLERSPLTVSGDPGPDLQNLAKVALFFPPVRHLWPDKDTIEGLAQYMNDTTCRKYFGELRSMMVELTPTVFGAISDKYDGNRRLAQQVNRPVTDWIRDRWLHCINIVASDYFLGNDMIELSIYANKMRAHQSRNAHTLSTGASTRCQSFKKIGHLLDKSGIPLQFTLHKQTLSDGDGDGDYDNSNDMMTARPSSDRGDTRDHDAVAHTSSDGNRIFLRPVKTHKQHSASGRDRRDSFAENFSDGFSSLFSSFKRLLNL